MYILLAISILCSVALVLASVAIARHVRSRRLSAGPQTDFAEYLFAAAKDQDPRTLPQQNVRDVIAKTSSNHALEQALVDTRNQFISSKRP
jgi:hypothetical protein